MNKLGLFTGALLGAALMSGTAFAQTTLSMWLRWFQNTMPIAAQVSA